MKTYAMAAAAIAVLAACGGGRGRASQQDTTASPAADHAEGAVTITGCLVPSGATESAGARISNEPPPPRFTLIDAGTSRSYSLVADAGRLDDLQRFANSRVEVTGLIVASTGTGTTDVGAASAPVGAPPGDVRRVRVKDVRQLERTCGAAKKD